MSNASEPRERPYLCYLIMLWCAPEFQFAVDRTEATIERPYENEGQTNQTWRET
jgi:hypothetical protein